MATNFENLPKEKLIELLHIYAKNLLALDGTWFQSIEKKHGMEEAVEHDENAWRRYTEAEGRRIKAFLHLPDNSGVEGLKQALAFRMNAIQHTTHIQTEGNTLIYQVLDCRVQTARSRKGMPFHPCKSVGILEHTYFAKVIDSRFECEALSCYPDITINSCSCAWKFTLNLSDKKIV